MSQGEAKRQAPPTTVANPKPSKRGTINTRSSDHWLFGASLSELPQTKLPLKVHIIRRYLFLKDLYFAGKNMNASHKNALVGKIADELIFLWKEKGNLPTVDRTTVVKKMLLNITSSLEFSATNKSRYSTNQLWINKILKENFFDLFDIFICRCFKDKKEERNVTMDNCKETCGMVQFCSKEDFEFYVEQKFHWNEPFQSNRKNSKFVETSEVNENQLNQNLPGNSKCENSKSETLDPTSPEVSELIGGDNEDESEADNSEDDDIYQPSSSFLKKSGYIKRSNNKREFPTYISVCQRYAVSQRTAACLLNALMLDLDQQDPSFYVSRNKIRSMTEKYGKKLVKEHQKISGIECISFDAKKSTLREIHSKKSENKEEMFTVTCEPGGDFLHHFIPEDGTGQAIGRMLYNVVNLYDSEDSLLAILSDGTAGEYHKYVLGNMDFLTNFYYLIAVNSGHENGAIRCLELLLEKPLQWCICQLHFNELIYKRLIGLYVGETKGPSKRNTDLDNEIRNVAKNLKPITNYKRIAGNLQDDVDHSILQNYDQKYLYMLSCAIARRDGRKNLLEKFGTLPPPPPPGAIHEARWLTYANAAMRLYIQKENPSDDFQRLIFITVHYYVPMFLSIKMNSQIWQGTRHFFNAISRVRTLDAEEQREAFPGFLANSFMSHSESIILCGVMDPRLPTRKKFVRLLLQARSVQESSGSDQIRQYIKPRTVNFEAKCYHDLLDYSNISVPPLLMKYDKQTLEQHARGENEISIPNILCHSTNTERAVQNTAFAGDNAIGEDGRERFLLNLQKSRKDYNKDAKKSDFFLKK